MYSLHGDGELDEGQNWEAIMFAAAKGLIILFPLLTIMASKLTALQKVMDLGNLKAKFEAFGWQVMEMEGNDMDAVVSGLENAKLLPVKENRICYFNENRNG